MWIYAVYNLDFNLQLYSVFLNYTSIVLVLIGALPVN